MGKRVFELLLIYALIAAPARADRQNTKQGMVPPEAITGVSGAEAW